jgi:hypothetical protein
MIADRGILMDTKRILTELEAQRARIDRAIAAIEGIGSDGATRSATRAPKKRGGISAAGRKRLSELLKRRWAQGKMKRRAKARPKATKAAARRSATKKARANGGMSAAARKRLSEMMKKRWAERKKAKTDA